ncbi:MAG TPA: FAD-dependent monooxygenase [Mycobacterium sp.]|nr:FAD-dependent monooxygenase [Mycobacterium sp.]
MTDTDVLVVGAGPAGLGLACGLMEHGVQVRVVDKASGPATTSRANFLHARGSEVLDRLGALGDLPQRSVRALRVTTYLGGEPVMNIRLGDTGTRTAAPPMLISQAAVEAALRDRLVELGGQIEWGTPLVDLRQDDAGVRATLGGGEEARCRWLAGCDGAASTTRRLVGIGFLGVQLTERFLLADVHLDWDLDRSGTTAWIHPAGLIGAMPMPDESGRLWRIIAYDPGQRSEKPNEEQIYGRLEDILPDRTGRAVHLADAVWLSMFSVHRRLADTYRCSRVLLTGDAAHTHSPFGGQGMLTGLGDAENLAFKLALVASGHAESALLDTYERERRPLATEVLRGTTAITKVNVAQGPVGRFIRDRLMVPVVNLAPIQRRATYRASQLWVNYRGGPLARRSLPLRGPRAGDRVPDVSCARLDGGSTRLYAELRGRWALMLPDDGQVELGGTARNRLGNRLVILRHDARDAFLVRPDGHLAWRGRRSDALDRWLNGALANGTVR